MVEKKIVITAVSVSLKQNSQDWVICINEDILTIGTLQNMSILLNGTIGTINQFRVFPGAAKMSS